MRDLQASMKGGSAVPDEPYHEGSRRLQDRFDTRRLADLGAEALFGEDPPIDAKARAFIETHEPFPGGKA
jgi:hypothetical protein